MSRKKRKRPVQNRPFGKLFLRFRPPVLFSCLGALLFSAASLYLVTGKPNTSLPQAMEYAIFILAALFLTLATWDFIILCRKKAPFQMLSDIAHQHRLLSKLWEDHAFRTFSLGYGSLAINSLLAFSKMAAGWWLSSKWLMVLAGYYLVLSLSKALILQSGRSIARQSRAESSTKKEWNSYRLCGFLLILLSLTLQGVVLLIVREGRGFSYQGNLIYLVALLDFYGLTSAIIYFIRNRNLHSPVILAIKHLSFAASMVSMLSLQTAMFASFGANMAMERQRLMNMLTGTAVCVILILSGLAMVAKATRRLKKERP